MAGPNSEPGLPLNHLNNEGNDSHEKPQSSAGTSERLAPAKGSTEKVSAHVEEVQAIEPLQHMDTSFEHTGEAQLYDSAGNLTLIPAPTPDPKDPLNLPLWHKLLGMGSLCLFGALVASAELILGAMLPVFVLEYAHVDPKILKPLTEQAHGFPMGSNPLKFLENFPNAPSIVHVYLLASLPVLMMGLANFFLIPLAITLGRRPVVLSCGFIAVAGAVWAGHSTSLDSHLAARAIQAVGAGTVESLIPFILQDTVYIHQRNMAISCVFACQGAIIIGLGIASPYMIIYLNWRWVYFITASAASVFLVGVILFMPETRYNRTVQEHKGIPRPAHTYNKEPRTLKDNLAFFQGKVEWRKGLLAIMDSLSTFFYPHIFFITMLNSGMIATALAAGYTVTPALLTQPWSWPFFHLGFCLFPVLIAAVAVAVITGHVADRVANYFAKKRGQRLPENQLINMVLPTICAVLGTILFGLAGQHPDRYPWAVFLLALGLMAFGFLGANTVGAVYVLESYPRLAG